MQVKEKQYVPVMCYDALLQLLIFNDNKYSLIIHLLNLLILTNEQFLIEVLIGTINF